VRFLVSGLAKSLETSCCKHVSCFVNEVDGKAHTLVGWKFAITSLTLAVVGPPCSCRAFEAIGTCVFLMRFQ